MILGIKIGVKNCWRCHRQPSKTRSGYCHVSDPDVAAGKFSGGGKNSLPNQFQLCSLHDNVVTAFIQLFLAHPLHHWAPLSPHEIYHHHQATALAIFSTSTDTSPHPPIQSSRFSRAKTESRKTNRQNPQSVRAWRILKMRGSADMHSLDFLLLGRQMH